MNFCWGFFIVSFKGRQKPAAPEWLFSPLSEIGCSWVWLAIVKTSIISKTMDQKCLFTDSSPIFATCLLMERKKKKPKPKRFLVYLNYFAGRFEIIATSVVRFNQLCCMFREAHHFTIQVKISSKSVCSWHSFW